MICVRTHFALRGAGVVFLPIPSPAPTLIFPIIVKELLTFVPPPKIFKYVKWINNLEEKAAGERNSGCPCLLRLLFCVLDTCVCFWGRREPTSGRPPSSRLSGQLRYLQTYLPTTYLPAHLPPYLLTYLQPYLPPTYLGTNRLTFTYFLTYLPLCFMDKFVLRWYIYAIKFCLIKTCPFCMQFKLTINCIQLNSWIKT